MGETPWRFKSSLAHQIYELLLCFDNCYLCNYSLTYSYQRRNVSSIKQPGLVFDKRGFRGKTAHGRTGYPVHRTRLRGGAARGAAQPSRLRSVRQQHDHRRPDPPDRVACAHRLAARQDRAGRLMPRQGGHKRRDTRSKRRRRRNWHAMRANSPRPKLSPSAAQRVLDFRFSR